MGEYHPGVILVWCVIASSGDYISNDLDVSRWQHHHWDNNPLHSNCVRPCNHVSYHSCRRVFAKHHSSYNRQRPKLNMLHNVSIYIQLPGPSWICITIAQPTHKANCDTQAEIGVVVGRKNNRRGRLLNTLINSNNEVINVTFARNEQRKFTPKISSNPPRSFKISAIVSKRTKQIAPDYWSSECGPSWIPSDHIRVKPN